MKIGNLSLNNNVFLAPMAGITDLIFRTVARRFGSALCFTEMVSSNGLVRKTARSYEYLESSPEDRPLGVQIFGEDPRVLSEAARIVTDRGADLVDINMGCPVKKIVKTGAGGALMKDPRAVAAILKNVRKATPLPLTIKIRSGWKRHGENAVEIATIAESCGVDAVILHPRTVEQGFSDEARWDDIARVKEKVSIPVVGSGDVRRGHDAVKMIEMTGCDGVMIGRGALGNPWIFRDIAGCFEGKHAAEPTLKEREDIIRWHLEKTISRSGEMAGMRKFRKQLLWYTKGLREGAQFRKRAVSLDDKDEILEAVHKYFESLAIREEA